MLAADDREAQQKHGRDTNGNRPKQASRDPERTRKFGFPEAKYRQRNELKEEVMEFLGGPYLRRQGLFHEPYVARLLHEHFTGRHNHYKQIWVLFTLQKWLHGRKIQLP